MAESQNPLRQIELVTHAATLQAPVPTDFQQLLPRQNMQSKDSQRSSSNDSRCSSSDSSCKSSADPSTCLSCSHGLYRYEPKRAGGVYEQMLRVIRAGNNSNTVPGIRDVQVHRSLTGQHTRVETELQPTGATADLNINIIMDSDSNLSNALGGQASIEYESLDQSGASEDIGAPSGGIDGIAALAAPDSAPDASAGSAGGSAGPSSLSDTTGGRDPASGGSAGGGGPSDDASGGAVGLGDDAGGVRGSRGGDPLSDPSQGIGASPGSLGRSSEQNAQSASSEAAQPSSSAGARAASPQPTSPISAPVASPSEEETPTSLPPGAASPRRAEADDDEDDEDDDEEEGGEGEEGDMDDAQRHFQRYLDGEKVEVLRGPGKDDEARETRRKLPVGHLEKEGVVIGCMSVFADVHLKEYIVFLSDEMIQAFLVDPGRFRSVANRTKCEIEVTRRILNRRMGRYRWLKYLIVDIRGPSYSAIDQCDKMMSMLFPPYKNRKPYGAPAMVSMFLKETTPDNTDLYFNFQRTGPSQRMYGEIPLRAPFRKTKTRPVETTPWKAVQKRQQWGTLEPKNDRMETVMSHVYPERGGTYTSALDHSIKWAEAAEQAVVMSKAKDMARAQMLKSRKVESEPLFANVLGD
ncbi:hypothetical protein BOX15_Mlig020950g1 [Macrostomum lignano]|uniref:Uncharacterized protein n=1 Tax=Macrostomum lignano TaxID=282301 RepID=A0A267GND7_9PLAT|nr:hypothetical protein BOX15_Mlig020950g1 [Macrostomum lignano]